MQRSITMTVATAAGPALALLVGWTLTSLGFPASQAWTAAVTVLCAVWWIFEPVPIPVTSLIPISVLPLAGVLTPQDVGAAVGDPVILLLMGGFILSTAMARSGVHRRLALNMVSLFGGRANRWLVMGFMVAAATLSMWISNTATALMLLPIALAVCEGLDDRRLQISLLLGIAYACSIGGIGTPIGTPPNLIFMSVYADATGTQPGFIQWMSWALPVVIVMVPIAALWLTRRARDGGPVDLPRQGQWRPEEKRTLAVFAVTALLWVTRSEPFGGWRSWLDLPNANDASVALMAVVVMFLIPNGRGGRLLNWETAVKIPWGLLILFGSGVTIARAFVGSGLSDQLGAALAGLSVLPLVLMLGAICLSVTFLTEITSNTATTALLMPVLAAAAVAMDIDPRIIMVPAAISASCAFMLPVATGPNAVVFGSGEISIATMAREGFALNLIGVVVVTTLSYWLLR